MIYFNAHFGGPLPIKQLLARMPRRKLIRNDGVGARNMFCGLRTRLKDLFAKRSGGHLTFESDSPRIGPGIERLKVSFRATKTYGGVSSLSPSLRVRPRNR